METMNPANALYISPAGEIAHKTCGGHYLAEAELAEIIPTPLGAWIRADSAELAAIGLNRCETCAA